MATIFIDKTFKTEKDKIDFVMDCESDFEKRLNEVAEEILKISRTNKIFTLSGPTCSGKTTAAKKIISTLSMDGKKVKIISIDDFFKKRTVSHDDAIKYGVDIDYDSIESLDVELLSDRLHKVCRGEATSLPQYDFTVGDVVAYNDYNPADYDFVLFEGIQIVYPEVSSVLAHYGYCSIYISVRNDMCVNGEHFSISDIRFLRRLVRDCKFRSSSPEFTYYYWEKVRDNEKRNIIPNEDSQDYKIDSTLAYELFMLKPYAEKLLKSVKENSICYQESQIMLERLSKLDSISNEYLPKNSLYHEFLG